MTSGNWSSGSPSGSKSSLVVSRTAAGPSSSSARRGAGKRSSPTPCAAAASPAARTPRLHGTARLAAEILQAFRDAVPVPRVGGRVSAAEKFLGPAVVPRLSGTGEVTIRPADPAPPPARIAGQPRLEEFLGPLGQADFEAVRLEAHPLIRFHAVASGQRQPLVLGTRLYVHQVMSTFVRPAATCHPPGRNVYVAGDLAGHQDRRLRGAAQVRERREHDEPDVSASAVLSPFR